MRQFKLNVMLLLAGLVLSNSPAAAVEPPQNVVVFKESGQFGGWPANHGMWIWGNEIVLGHRLAKFKVVKQGHAVDSRAPQYDVQARSLDGGVTWTTERPAAFTRVEDGGPPVSELVKPMEFTHPDFAFMCRYSKETPAARFYYSLDRAKTWNGPYRLPTFNQPRVMGRTDILIDGPHEATLVLTAAKQNNEEGRIFTAKTTDGGVSWKFVTFIGPEPAGFSIMPSSVRLSDKKILTTIRCQVDDLHWIEAYQSTDNGATFSFLNKPADSTGSNVGNPPSLLKLKDGRLAIIYGYRSEPYGIRARISRDQGQTWGSEIHLRDDAGCWDLGYPRSVQRPDGKIVSAYYYNDHADSERYIAATIWSPESESK